MSLHTTLAASSYSVPHQRAKLLVMAAKETHVEVGSRSVRVSSPDRVVFEPTDESPAATKLDVVNFYATVGTEILRALDHRPTTLERWPRGVRPGMKLTNGPSGKGDAFYNKRVPQGAPRYIESALVYFPSGRRARQLCPTEPAAIAWAAQMGTITFHPWSTRRLDNDRPDELRIDLDPQGDAGFSDASRVALLTREVLNELGIASFVKTSGGRGVHVFVRITPSYTFTDVRHAVIALGRELERRDDGVTTAWWKEERGSKIFVDFNQNARDRTIASAYSLRPRPGAPVSTPLTWDELPTVSGPESFTLFSVPELLQERPDPWARIDDESFDIVPLLQWYERDVESGQGEMPYPPDYPKMPGEPKRVQPSRRRS